MATERTPIGLLLQERREARRWSRTDVQQRTRVPSPTLEKWEMGRVKQPPAEPLLRVARELGIDMDELWRALAEGAVVATGKRGGRLEVGRRGQPPGGPAPDARGDASELREQRPKGRGSSQPQRDPGA